MRGLGEATRNNVTGAVRRCRGERCGDRGAAIGLLRVCATGDGSTRRLRPAGRGGFARVPVFSVTTGLVTRVPAIIVCKCNNSEAEAQDLVKPFTMAEIEKALLDMDTHSAPGLDRLRVGFYRVLA